MIPRRLIRSALHFVLLVAPLVPAGGVRTAIAAGWTPVFETPTQEIPIVLSSPDDQVCWFITNFDRIYETENGGATWSSITTGAFVPATLFVVNATTAFKSGSNSIWRTTDGGLHWSSVFSRTGGGPPVVWMLSPSNGFMTFAGQLFRTTDGGTSWTQSGIAQPPSPIAIGTGTGTLEVTGNHLWVALASGGAAVSHDLAATWIQPLNAGLSFGDAFRLSFADASFGLLIQRNLPYIYVTTDGANHWAACDNSMGANESVVAAGALGWYIPNPSDHDYIKYTSDHGASWTVQLVDPDAGLGTLTRSRTGSRLWSGNTLGRIYRYDDATSAVAPAGLQAGETAALRATPNPCGEGLELAGPASALAVTYRVFTVRGRLALAGPVHGSRLIDSSSLPSGAYLVEVRDPLGAATCARFVKR